MNRRELFKAMFAGAFASLWRVPKKRHFRRDAIAAWHGSEIARIERNRALLKLLREKGKIVYSEASSPINFNWHEVEIV